MNKKEVVIQLKMLLKQTAPMGKGLFHSLNWWNGIELCLDIFLFNFFRLSYS